MLSNSSLTGLWLWKGLQYTELVTIGVPGVTSPWLQGVSPSVFYLKILCSKHLLTFSSVWQDVTKKLGNEAAATSQTSLQCSVEEAYMALPVSPGSRPSNPLGRESLPQETNRRGFKIQWALCIFTHLPKKMHKPAMFTWLLESCLIIFGQTKRNNNWINWRQARLCGYPWPPSYHLNFKLWSFYKSI